MGHWGGNRLAFPVLSSVYGALVLNVFVAFTVFVLFMECFGLDVCGIHNVCCVSEAFRLVFLFYFFSYSFCGLAWRVAFMVHWCGTLVAFTAFVAFIRRLGCPLFVAFRVFVTFMGHWGGTLVAFTVLVVFTGHWGWTFVVFFNICSV